MNILSIPPVALILLISAMVLIAIVALYTLFSSRRSKQQTKSKDIKHDIHRHHANPVISPMSHREWEAQGTLNPTAVEDDEGNVHLFYRAIGADGISRVSHAFSKDGTTISEQSSFPVYVPVPGYGMPASSIANAPHRYDPIAHPSGGGWGGAEDPRTTRIGDRIYMTYTAFEGWNNMRIGLTSISVDDVKKRRWNWKRPHLISPAKARSKNWMLFPEKIHGKFAILHSIAPKVLIAYLDSLDIVPVIESSADHGGYGTHDKSREKYWDTTMKGAGTPPIKTDKGWLVLYHAIHENKYKVGAMLLDLDDPTKILYRSPEPILSPEMCYENDGKPGVVYASGAIIKNSELMVYYGGGDKHVCVAQTNLESLLGWLMQYGKV